MKVPQDYQVKSSSSTKNSVEFIRKPTYIKSANEKTDAAVEKGTSSDPKES